MNDLVAAALLGLVQGLTEFLPISSTAHLALAEKVLRLEPARYGLSFTVALHMGTLVAVLIYFARFWLELLADLARGRVAMLGLLLVATVPAVVVALIFDEAIEGPLRDPRLIATALVVGSLVFVVAERQGARNERRSASIMDALAIGIAQALALVPGLSRSGMTISAGLARGLRRDEAARLSFILATPAVFGAGVKTALDARTSATLFERPDALLVGFVASLISGIGAVAFLVRFLRGHSLAWFVPYRLALAALIVTAIVAGVI